MPRPLGSSNKNKTFLLNRLKEMLGEDFHPIMNMAKNASEFQKLVDDKKIEPALMGGAYIEANKLWGGIAEYVEPKLKAVEISGNAENPLTIRGLTDAELERIAASSN